MKNITTAFKSWLIANPSCYRADLLQIALPNGQIIRAVMGAAADLLRYAGQNWYATASGIWTRGSLESEAMLGNLASKSLSLSVSAAESVLYPGSSVPMSESFVLGVWDAATVTVSTVYMPAGSWGAASVQGEMAFFSGMISDSRRTGRSQGTLTAQDWLFLANTNVPIRVIQPGCANTFGDAACTFSLAGIALNNAVGTGFTPVYIPPGTAWPANDARGNSISASYSGVGYFAGGKLQWTSGQNSGFWSSIAASDSSGNLTLAQAPAFPVAAGDGFTAYAGCQKTFTDCTARWGNEQFFTGEPFVPPPESAV